jgi:hypothetical protein
MRKAGEVLYTLLPIGRVVISLFFCGLLSFLPSILVDKCDHLTGAPTDLFSSAQSKRGDSYTRQPSRAHQSCALFFSSCSMMEIELLPHDFSYSSLTRPPTVGLTVASHQSRLAPRRPILPEPPSSLVCRHAIDHPSKPPSSNASETPHP